MPIDPKEPISLTERAVYGHDARRHKVLGFVIEQGSGALHVDAQAENYISEVEAIEGRAAANALRAKLKRSAQPPSVVRPA